jgi:hypothetical protein
MHTELYTDCVQNPPASANQEKALKLRIAARLLGEGDIVGGGGDHSASRRTSLRSATLRRTERVTKNVNLPLNHGQ